MAYLNAGTLVAVLELDTTGYKRGTSEAKSLTESLQKAMEVAAGVMIRDFARSAFGAVTGAAEEASQSFQAYELTLGRIISATSATGAQAEDLTRQLASVSKEQEDLGFSARESAAALEALVKAGMSGSDASEALRASLSLARLENIDTATAAAYLVQTLTQFNLTASDSAGALDLISKAADAGIGTASDYAAGLSNAGASAANMGLSLQETLAALVILDKTFGSATESGTFLNMLFKDLVLKSDKLGLSLYNADGSMKSLSEIIEALRTKVSSFGDNQQAVNEYLSVFDVRAQRAVVGLLNYDGSIGDVIGSMNEARDVQDKVNIVMDTTAGKLASLAAREENASLKLGEMTAALQVAWKEFAVGLGPIGAIADAMGPALLQGAMNGLVVMLPTIIKGFNSLGVSTKALAVSVGAAFAGFTIGYTILNALTGNLNSTEKAIIGITVAAAAAAIAFTVLWTVGTAGVALPVILGAVGVAVAGVTLALSDAGVEADNYAGSMQHVASASDAAAASIQENTAQALQDEQTHLANMLTAENQFYDDSIAAHNAYFDEKFGLTETETTKLLAKIERYYEDQKRIEDDAYASELDGIRAYFTDRWGTTETELTKVADFISSYYAGETRTLQGAYDEQIRATNAFYDEMLGAVSAGLENIRAERTADLNALELDMLLQKQTLKQAYEDGTIDKETFEAKMTELQSTYSQQRSDISDEYRIQELEAQKELQTQTTTIEQEREAALTAIREEEAAKVAELENQKATDIQEAQTLIETATSTHNENLVNLENEKNADIDKAKNELDTLAAEHAATIEQITQDSETKQQNIINDANAAILEAIRSHYNEVVNIANEAYQKYLDNYEAAKDNAAKAAEESNKAYASLQQAQSSYNQAQTAANQAALEAARAAAAKAAAKQIQETPVGVPLAAPAGTYQGTLAEYNALPYDVKKYYAPPAAAEGAIVWNRQLVEVAEKGPEAIVPLDKLNKLGQQPVIVQVDVYGNTFASGIDIQSEFDKAGESIVRKLQNKGFLRLTG